MEKQAELFNLERYTSSEPMWDWAIDVAEQEQEYIPRAVNTRTPKTPPDDSLTNTESVSESSPESVSESPKPKPFSIHTYYPAGKARGGSCYYRLTYRDGKRVRHIHIPGGAKGNALVEKRIAELLTLLEQGKPLAEALSLVHTWKGRKSP